MIPLCDVHREPATLVVTYLEAVPHDPDGFDAHERLACSPTCYDPLWSGERWVWAALTLERAEAITGMRRSTTADLLDDIEPGGDGGDGEA